LHKDVTMDKEYVYYFPKTDHFNVVPEEAHDRFSIWVISKHGASVDDFWWENQTKNDVVRELLELYEKEIIFLGEL